MVYAGSHGTTSRFGRLQFPDLVYSTPNDTPDHVINQVVTNVTYGEDPFEGFDDLGRSFLVSEVLGVAQFGIGELGAGFDTQWEGSVGHLLLHGGAGCVALEAAGGDCAAGFFAGASSSVLAGSNLDDDQKLALAPLEAKSLEAEHTDTFSGTICNSSLRAMLVEYTQQSATDACGPKLSLKAVR